MIRNTKPILLLKIETKFNDSHNFSSHHKKIDQKNQPWKRNASAKRLKRASHKSNEWGKTIFSYIHKNLTLTYIDGVNFVRKKLLFSPLIFFLYEKLYGVFVNWKKKSIHLSCYVSNVSNFLRYGKYVQNYFCLILLIIFGKSVNIMKVAILFYMKEI